METQKKVITYVLTALILAIAVQAQDFSVAGGGNITPFIDIGLTSQTQRWDGVVGVVNFALNNTPIDATGGNITQTLINATSPCPNPTNIKGQIIFSNSTTIPVGFVAGNLTLLDNFVGGEIDNASNTFTDNQSFAIGPTTYSGVPVAFPYIAGAPQTTTYREGYFNDAFGNLIFASEVDFSTTGFNSTQFDFQVLLPTKNTTTVTYYITTILDFTCPSNIRPGGGGGGNRGGGGGVFRCPGTWICTPWNSCAVGIEKRKCDWNSTVNCIPRVTPYLQRRCVTTQTPANFSSKIKQQEVIKTLDKGNLKLIVDKILTTIGTKELINAYIKNNGNYTEEQLSVTLNIAKKYQPLLPLQKKPILYKLAGANPYILKGLETKINATQSNKIKVKPSNQNKTQLKFTAPIIKPQKIQGFAILQTNDIIRDTQPIEINVQGVPFKIMAQKRRDKTDVFVLIDNTNKPQRKINLELDFNKAKQTPFADLYTLDLPANDYALFGQTFLTRFEFDTISASFESKKTKVKI